MHQLRSEWTLTASCSACHGRFSLASAAVLVRTSLLGRRGVVLDAIGERWPEDAPVLHPQCFASQFGRRALWTAFARGRFDTGVGQATPTRRGGRARDAAGDVVVPDDAVWSLTVSCCECSKPVRVDGPAVVQEAPSPQRWRWVPVLTERRPGHLRVYHLRCFVDSHSRTAAYALLGLDLWERTPKAVKRFVGGITPQP